MKVHEQRNENTYLPRSVTGCRSQGLIRSTSPVSHLKTPHIVNISIEYILGPGLSLTTWAVRGCNRKIKPGTRYASAVLLYSLTQKCKKHRRLMSSKTKTWGQKNVILGLAKSLFFIFNFLRDREALKMRFHELGLERTSISYFTGPPGLVDNTAKSITCEDRKTVKQPTTLLYSKAYWSLDKQDQRSAST